MCFQIVDVSRGETAASRYLHVHYLDFNDGKALGFDSGGYGLPFLERQVQSQTLDSGYFHPTLDESKNTYTR